MMVAFIPGHVGSEVPEEGRDRVKPLTARRSVPRLLGALGLRRRRERGTRFERRRRLGHQRPEDVHQPHRSIHVGPSCSRHQHQNCPSTAVSPFFPRAARLTGYRGASPHAEREAHQHHVLRRRPCARPHAWVTSTADGAVSAPFALSFEHGVAGGVADIARSTARRLGVATERTSGTGLRPRRPQRATRSLMPISADTEVCELLGNTRRGCGERPPEAGRCRGQALRHRGVLARQHARRHARPRGPRERSRRAFARHDRRAKFVPRVAHLQTAGGTSEIQKNLIAERTLSAPTRPVARFIGRPDRTYSGGRTMNCPRGWTKPGRAGGQSRRAAATAGAVEVRGAEHRLGGLDPAVPEVDGLVGVNALASVELVRGGGRGGRRRPRSALVRDAARTGVFTAIDHAGGVVHGVTRGGDVDQHVGATVLHGLERADGRVPLLSDFTRSAV